MKRSYLFLFSLLALGFFLRVYKLDTHLGFYFDQGRDALVVWDLWQNGKLFLIGPTTGIEGIFRGPWYYWLITPAYALGNGNPVYPAVFLALTSVLAIGILFFLTRRASGEKAAFLAIIIASFSYYLVLDSRWLSNPTPMHFISMIFIWFLWRVLENQKQAWWGVAFFFGLAMQFGSAAELFYLPVIIYLLFLKRKNLPTKNQAVIAFAFFFITILPQIVFDLRHKGILSAAITKFLFEEKSFQLSFWEVVKIRLPFYYQTFVSKIWVGERRIFLPFFFVALASLIFNWHKFWADVRIRITLLLFVSPLIGMFFFQGNNGNVYGYYFTGYFFVFILLFAILWAPLLENWSGVLLLAVFLAFFLDINFQLLKNYYQNGPGEINFAAQKQAVAWVYEDASGREFNLDVYVPPVIPYAYDYLFVWLGETRYNYSPNRKFLPLLYTVHEIDPSHPERIGKWLLRQKGIGKIEESETFDGITVERRTRL